MIVAIDYKTCNLGSIANMLRRVGSDVRIASVPSDLDGATKLILPGIGAFDTCARNLRAAGFEEPLRRLILEGGMPVLGICVGAQLLTRSSEEGHEPGLGWIEATTRRFPRGDLKVPHMGWNEVQAVQDHPLMEGYDSIPRFYFVHSYYMKPDRDENILSYTLYGEKFASAIVKDNIMGVQFHPEKSHRFGLQLMRNFVQI